MPPLRWFLVAMVTSVLLLGPVGVSAQQEAGRGIGLRLLEAPRDLADDPRARHYILDTVNPGATIERRLEVINQTDEELEIELYAAAASVENGWAVADGRGGNELAEWISVTPSSVTLAPGSTAEVVATIRVSGDAGGGERYAAILAEGPAREGGAVTVVPRVGVRVHLFVTGDAEPVSAFVIDALTAGRDEDGAPYVDISVTNTGERALDISGELRLSEGPGQLTAGPFHVAIPRTVAPGDEGAVRVAFARSLPDGPWLARADLRSGLVERAAEATITFPDSAGQVAAPAEATEVPLHQDRGILIPFAIGLTLLTLLLLLLFWRRRKRDEGEAAPHPADVGAG